MGSRREKRSPLRRRRSPFFAEGVFWIVSSGVEGATHNFMETTGEGGGAKGEKSPNRFSPA